MIILLDLGGVVFQPTGHSNEQIDWDIVNQLNTKFSLELNLGADTFQEFIDEYNLLTEQSLTGLQFLQFIFENVQMNEALIEFLRPLGEIIIVSDNYRENIAYMSNQYGLNDWASQQFYSYEYRIFKSSPAFFERVLTKIENPKQEKIILIDDDAKNIASAAEQGIHGILFQNNEQLKKELETLCP